MHTHTHTFTHHYYTCQKPAPLFFALIAPIIFQSSFAILKLVGWWAGTRRTTVTAGQLMPQDGGRTTVSVSWLAKADGTWSSRANWSQEVQFWPVSSELIGRFWVFTGTWREASSHASGPGRNFRWASALEVVESSSGQSKWLPWHPVDEQHDSEHSPCS